MTVVAAGPLEREEQAKSWLEQCRRSEDNRDGECDDALLSLNKVISAHRIAAADPYAHEVTPGHAQVVRLGYGTGEEMVGGLWRAAYTLPRRRRRSNRRAMLAPQEELVAIIRERRPSQPSEELALRARLDLDQQRTREAALQLALALEALELELAATSGKAEELRRGSAEKLADAALRGPLTDQQVTELESLLTVSEREIRRRRHRGEVASYEAQGEPVEDRGEAPGDPPPAAKLEQ